MSTIASIRFSKRRQNASGSFAPPGKRQPIPTMARGSGTNAPLLSSPRVSSLGQSASPNPPDPQATHLELLLRFVSSFATVNSSQYISSGVGMEGSSAGSAG